MAALKVTDLNGVKVYNVTNNAALPQWLSEKQRRALRKDTEHSRRVELVQDLAMPTSTRKLLQSPDGEYLIATGAMLALALAASPQPDLFTGCFQYHRSFKCCGYACTFANCSSLQVFTPHRCGATSSRSSR